MIRPRYIRILIVNLCICFGLEFVQTANAQSSVHGNVKDSAGGPVAAVNILLLKAIDSILVKGTITLASGDYSFTNVPAGRYITAATCAGYLPSYSTAFDITTSDLQKTLGTIQ